MVKAVPGPPSPSWSCTRMPSGVRCTVKRGGRRQGVLAVHAVVYKGIGRGHGFSMRQDTDLASPGWTVSVTDQSIG
jgi:hypothetical protein